MCRPSPQRFDLTHNPAPTTLIMVAGSEEALTLDPAGTAGKTLVLEGWDATVSPDVAPCELVDLHT